MTTRHLGNMRTLGVFPCGECRAYVPLEGGCAHYKPRPITPRRPRRKVVPKKYDDTYSLMRLADSTRMRRILEDAARAKTGGVALTVKNDRHAANVLVRAGLLTLAGRGADYAITEDGRKIAAKVAELTPAPPAGGKPAPG